MSVVNEVWSSGAASRTTRVALVVVLAIAAIWSAVITIGVSMSIIASAVANEVVTTLSTETSVPAARAAGPLTSATYDSASVVVTGAPVGVQVITVIAASAAVVARLALGVAFVLLIVAVLRRAPFSQRLALQFTLCGGIAMCVALVSLGLGVLADWMVADFLNASGAGRWPIMAAVDPTLIPFGFALMVVGLLISYGAQLQHTTDGLV